MSTTTAFAIRRDQEDWGPHWVTRKRASDDDFTTTLMTACHSDVPPRSFLYADRAGAERDAELFRADARAKRSHKALPATLTVLEVGAGPTRSA
jgi:hypothetical protein